MREQRTRITREALEEINARTGEDFRTGTSRINKIWWSIGGERVERETGNKRHWYQWTDSRVEQAVVWVRMRKMFGVLGGQTRDGARSIRENLIDYVGEMEHRPTYLAVNYEGEVWDCGVDSGSIFNVPSSITVLVAVHFDCTCPS